MIDSLEGIKNRFILWEASPFACKNADIQDVHDSNCAPLIRGSACRYSCVQFFVACGQFARLCAVL